MYHDITEYYDRYYLHVQSNIRMVFVIHIVSIFEHIHLGFLCILKFILCFQHSKFKYNLIALSQFSIVKFVERIGIFVPEIHLDLDTIQAMHQSSADAVEYEVEKVLAKRLHNGQVSLFYINY